MKKQVILRTKAGSLRPRDKVFKGGEVLEVLSVKYVRNPEGSEGEIVVKYLGRPAEVSICKENDDVNKVIETKVLGWPVPEDPQEEMVEVTKDKWDRVVAAANTLFASQSTKGVCPKCGDFILLDGYVCFGCGHDSSYEDEENDDA